MASKMFLFLILLVVFALFWRAMVVAAEFVVGYGSFVIFWVIRVFLGIMCCLINVAILSVISTICLKGIASDLVSFFGGLIGLGLGITGVVSKIFASLPRWAQLILILISFLTVMSMVF